MTLAFVATLWYDSARYVCKSQFSICRLGSARRVGRRDNNSERQLNKLVARIGAPFFVWQCDNATHENGAFCVHLGD